MVVRPPDERKAVAALSKVIVTRVAPEELDLFDEMLDDYFGDPTPPDLSHSTADEPLGLGLGNLVVAVTPAAAAAATAAIGFVNRATIRQKGAAPLAPIAAVQALGPALTPEQLRELRQIAATTASRYGVGSDKADEIANAIVVALVIGPSAAGNGSRVFKILFLAANPIHTPSLRLDREVRSVEEALREARLRDRFVLEQRWAVRVTDLQQAFLRYEPDIVHFAGHASSEGGLIVEDMAGYPSEIEPAALSELFRVLGGKIRCVVLNACYSASQAEAVADHVDCVVGMSSSVSDDSAVEFATAFYQALAYGKDVRAAFELGINRSRLLGLRDAAAPQLLSKRKLASQVCFA